MLTIAKFVAWCFWKKKLLNLATQLLSWQHCVSYRTGLCQESEVCCDEVMTVLACLDALLHTLKMTGLCISMFV